METAQTKMLVGLLEAEFGEFPEARAVLFMDELAPFEWVDGVNGVREVIRTIRFLRLADVLDAIDAETRERYERERLERGQLVALPSGGGIPMPPEVLERVTALDQKFAEPSPAELAEVANKRAVAAILAGPKSRDFCGGGGQEPVMRDGKRVCPDCGVEVRDIPLTPSPKRRRDVFEYDEVRG